MAIVAKVDKETKKLQYLSKIYKKEDKENKPKKKATKEITPSAISETTRRLTRKELVNDLVIMLVVVGIAFGGYALARFINL